MKSSKIFIVELDGGTWNIIDPMIKKGELPNLKKLIETGSCGKLMSIMPSISPKIWTSIFSGKTHKQTGIDFFGGNSNMVKCKRIWDILSEKGLTVGSFGTFVTWPPYKINGFMIPAVDSVGTETYPKDYEFYQEFVLNERKKAKRIENKLWKIRDKLSYLIKLMIHGVSFKTFLKALYFLSKCKFYNMQHLDKYWRKLHLHMDLSQEIYSRLISKYKPHFSTFHIHMCDSICHRYWMYFEPDNFKNVRNQDVIKYKDVIPNTYRKADKAIGKLIKNIDDNTTIIVVSDHGFEGVHGQIPRFDLKVDSFLEVLGLKDKVIVAKFGTGMYMSFKDEELMKNISNDLKSVCIKETGDKIFNIKTHENIIILTKPTWNVAVDKVNEKTMLDFGKYGTHLGLNLFTKLEISMTGIHKKEGIIIFNGKYIKSGVKLGDYNIYDVAPTILYLLGFAHPNDMKGDIIKEAISDKYIDNNPITFIETYEDKDGIKNDSKDIDHDTINKRLKDLGYL